LDFACCEARLAIELDGGQHEERYKYDVQRTVWLNQKGWKIIRFWNNELWQNEEAVLEKIFEVLQTLLPSPGPLPKRRGRKNTVVRSAPAEEPAP
jgi:very-short-patch-repair endonuclease